MPNKETGALKLKTDGKMDTTMALVKQIKKAIAAADKAGIERGRSTWPLVGDSTPWPLGDCVSHLLVAVQHLFDAHDCDYLQRGTWKSAHAWADRYLRNCLEEIERLKGVGSYEEMLGNLQRDNHSYPFKEKKDPLPIGRRIADRFEALLYPGQSDAYGSYDRVVKAVEDEMRDLLPDRSDPKFEEPAPPGSETIWIQPSKLQEGDSFQHGDQTWYFTKEKPLATAPAAFAGGSWIYGGICSRCKGKTLIHDSVDFDGPRDDPSRRIRIRYCLDCGRRGKAIPSAEGHGCPEQPKPKKSDPPGPDQAEVIMEGSKLIGSCTVCDQDVFSGVDHVHDYEAQRRDAEMPCSICGRNIDSDAQYISDREGLKQHFPKCYPHAIECPVCQGWHTPPLCKTEGEKS